MEIKRRTEIKIATRRRFVVQMPDGAEQISCPQCETAELLITAEQAAAFFDVSRRKIYQFVETEEAHFIETETGVLLVCSASLADVLKSSERKNLGS